LFCLLAGLGCKTPAHSPEAGLEPPAKYAQVDQATAGAIEGTIRFAGKAPPLVRIDMAQDPGCATGGGANYTEQYDVHDGKMADVFVYIKSGLGSNVYAAPASPAVLDQKGCRYVPHVIGVMVGQAVEFRTSDPTMHNINVQPVGDRNPPFDYGQPPNGSPVRHTFRQPETMIPVRCNLHPWMQAFINVAPNPFFAVSDAQGHFAIHGLPPGNYTLAAIHEKLGTKELQVTVSPRRTSSADLTYAGD
jgi:plastocyanin